MLKTICQYSKIIIGPLIFYERKSLILKDNRIGYTRVFYVSVSMSIRLVVNGSGVTGVGRGQRGK